MKFVFLSVIALLASVSYGAHAQENTKYLKHAQRNMAMATIINNNETELGAIQLTQAPKGVLIHVDLEGLPPGKHGFHIHENGTCADHEDFKEAGGHMGKELAKHGLLHPEGYEYGDLPNLIVSENGDVEVELFAAGLSIGDGNATNDESVILDSDGAAFMIHENADDHITQPIGGAGARIACGVIGKNND
jgi:Cu-Zn family superoxide dismutase